MNHHSGDSSDLKIRSVTNWGQKWVGIYLSASMTQREGQSWEWAVGEAETGPAGGCTENKRTAIWVAQPYHISCLFLRSPGVSCRVDWHNKVDFIIPPGPIQHVGFSYLCLLIQMQNGCHNSRCHILNPTEKQQKRLFEVLYLLPGKETFPISTQHTSFYLIG